MSPWAITIGVAAAGWIYLLLLRGTFWRTEPVLEVGAPGRPAELARWPFVVAVVPARNEAETIGRAVASLRAQDYPGRLELVVVDDASEDGTGALARAAGGEGVSVIRGNGPPPGWTGKVAAMQAGLAEALGSPPAGWDPVAEAAASDAPAPRDPEWIWFTDADVEHDPGVLRALVARAERDGLHLVSTMVLLRARGFWEGLLVPAFVYFFRKLYPFRWVASPARRTAAAAGGSMLVRARTLQAVGGLGAIRDRVIDDCALARLIAARGPIWLGLTRASRSLRTYGFAGAWRMVTRTAFTQLGHSWATLALTLTGMAVLYVVPVAGTALGLAGADRLLAATAAATWLVMAASFLPTLRLYRRPPATALLLPLAGLLYAAMTLDSALRYAAGSGGRWKGRSQAYAGKR